MGILMVRFARNLSKKTGMSKQDLDAFLRVLSYELIEDLKKFHRVFIPNLGTFFCSSKEGRLTVRLSLIPEAYERLNKIDKTERVDEIIFE